MERSKFFRTFDKILDNFEDCKISAGEAIELICEVGLREHKNTARKNYILPDEIDGLIFEAKKIVGLGKKLIKLLSDFREKGSCPENTIVITGHPEDVILIPNYEK